MNVICNRSNECHNHDCPHIQTHDMNGDCGESACPGFGDELTVECIEDDEGVS